MNRWKTLLIACAAMAWTSASAAPGIINYQGQLNDPIGDPITVPIDVTFTFHDAVSGGAQLGAFSDTDTVTPNAKGIYSTHVGDEPGNPIPASIFDADNVWLNVEINGEHLAPRLRITSAGFAIHAADSDTLQGLQAEDFLNISADAFVIVKTTASATQNATNLLTAYTAAKALSPNGSALSATNRATLIVPPANYDLGGGSITLDADFVDVAGLSASRDSQYIYSSGNVLEQTANDVRIQNLVLHYTGASTGLHPYRPTASWNSGANTGSPPETTIRNCEFRTSARSMLTSAEYAGVYEDCLADNHAFGAIGIASGTFTNCTIGDFGFGAFGTASGTFINCIGGDYAFGGATGSSAGIASGTFTNCTGGTNAFAGGSLGISSGTFNNCIGGNNAFGGFGSASGGKFHHCVGGTNSFSEVGATAPVQLFCIQDGTQYIGNN